MSETTAEILLDVLTIAGLCAPVGLFVFFAGWALLSLPPHERTFGVAIRITTVISIGAFLGAAGVFLVNGTRSTGIPLGTWISTPSSSFDIELLLDRLSLPLAVYTSVLCGVVGTFAERYLTREPGYVRFFLLFSLFWVGMLLVVLAGTVELLYGGWEFVGLSSALLIAYHHERPDPPANGLRAYVVYRMCDLGLIAAALLCHHWLESGDFSILLGSRAWPAGEAGVQGGRALVICLLFTISAAGKSAQIPFSGWLPRAMEGPTPSSAIFYGALSLHAGAFLLLRIGPLLEEAPWAAGLVVVMGLGTAIHATLVGRVQTDIKSALAYSALTQVSIILVEIGLGLRYLALLHLLGHAATRVLQLLRSPSLLHDQHELDDASAGRIETTTPMLRPQWFRAEALLPLGLRLHVYRISVERWSWDDALDRFIVHPFLAVFHLADRTERALLEFLFGKDTEQ